MRHEHMIQFRLAQVWALCKLALAYIISLFYKRGSIWLVCERGVDARDNGYWFFRYLRTHYPEIKAYYLITKNSPDRERVQTFADYVIEQGTSGIWRYRKWNSGVYECFGTQTGSIAVTTASAGYGGYRSGQLSIPTFPITFTATPTVTATVGSGSQGAWVNNVQPSTTGGFYYLSSGASLSATNRSIQFQVMGRWK